MIYVTDCDHPAYMSSMGDRLRQAREEAGFKSRRQAAERLGIGYTTLSAHESGQNSISADAAQTYAKAFNVSPSWLIFGDEADVPRSYVDAVPEIRFAPVVGWVQAGVWQEPHDSDEEFTQYRPIKPHPRYPNSPYVVLEVRGDSFNNRAPEGSWVVVLPWAETGLMTPLHGQVIIAEQSDMPVDTDGSDVGGAVQRTLKRVQINGQDVLLEPDSTNPKHKPVRLDKQTRAFGLVVSVIQDLEV